MLSLLTLEKLIKLEFCALYSIAWKKHIHVASKTRAFYAFGDLTSELWDYVSYTFHYNNITFCSKTFALDLPTIGKDVCPVAYTTAHTLAVDVTNAIESDATTPNPNRFVKSSFALSLLWTAKFYRSINNQYVRTCKADNDSFHAYVTCFRSLLHILTGERTNLFRAIRNQDQWVRGHS